ncbi:MAG: UDP-3-O-(3-hydroxymyristoyl)glucosamine N-acyltransferase [Pseudobacteriovorax sp.]|nr:UDP-3-O-(3-hydroxymyristoyl)glucosamine N-acyltransferase [Pseudobacteriovorax sp.]
MRVTEIAEVLNMELVAPKSTNWDVVIESVAPIDQANPGTITFVTNAKYAEYLQQSQASAVICQNPIEDLNIPQLLHKNPHLGFAKVASLFHRADHGPVGVSKQANIADSATLGENLTIYPFVVISEHAEIGADVVIYPGVFIGPKAKVGSGTVLHPNVFVGERCIVGRNNIIHASTVIGADGFGFTPDGDSIFKIPQTGIVEIGDNVELGGACTLDRATMGATKIGDGCKFDSKVHIGHNAETGSHTMMSAHTSLAGSAKVGNWVLIGGHSAVSGHIEVGDRMKIGAMTGVIKSFKKEQTLVGFPAVPAMQWRRAHVHVQKISEYEKRIRKLEATIEELKTSILGDALKSPKA